MFFVLGFAEFMPYNYLFSQNGKTCSPLICLYAQIVNSQELECLLHVFDSTRLKLMLQSFKNVFMSYNFYAG